jgi:dihydroorotate dehydrogenase
LINRLGFNNAGSEAVARSLAATLRRSPVAIPLGINIGKSRATPLEEAARDYTDSFRRLAHLAAYVVVNVSSPNTPGLRGLQDAAQLAALIDVLQAENRRLVASGALPSAKPLLVKIAPDLGEDDLVAVVRVVREHGAAGIVATNTTIDRAGLHTRIDEEGGLSGAPLRARSTAVVRRVRQLAGPTLPIIGVGGIFSAADAYEKIRAGAWLVQGYTGFIYEGPGFAPQITAGLVDLLQRDGMQHLREAIGRDA